MLPRRCRRRSCRLAGGQLCAKECSAGGARDSSHLQRAALDLPTRAGLQHPPWEGSASQSSLRLVLPFPGFSSRQLYCRRPFQLVRRRPELWACFSCAPSCEPPPAHDDRKKQRKSGRARASGFVLCCDRGAPLPLLPCLRCVLGECAFCAPAAGAPGRRCCFVVC